MDDEDAVSEDSELDDDLLTDPEEAEEADMV